MRILLRLAALATLTLVGAAQDDRPALQRRIDELRRAGKTAETEPLLLQLLDFETQASGEESERIAPILDHLARIALSSNRYDRAQELYERAIAGLQKVKGKSSPALIPILQALVRAQQIAQKYPEAVGTQMRLITIRLNSESESSPDLAGDYVVLARLYAAQSNFLQASMFYNWAVEILEKQYGVDDGRLLPALDGLAASLRDDHKLEQAAAVLVRIVSIREALVGPMHPDLAQTLDNLGASYYGLKRFAEAEPAYRRSLSIWIKHLGPTHPMVATSLDNLGVTYASQEKFEEAEEIYRQALAIRETEETASLRNLALVLTGRKKYADAEPYFKRALVLLSARKVSPDLIITMHDYADALDRLHRKAEAEKYRRRAKSLEAELAAELGAKKPPVPVPPPGR